MKNTALTAIHGKLDAKMVPFAGYNMPVQYEGVIAEHNNVREHVGVFDVSHMGEFWVRGPQALDLVQRVTSNDASKLVPGKIQYSCLPNNEGGIVDDLLVYCVDPENFLLVVNASNIEKDWNWISSHNDFDCRMEDASDEISLLAVQGPKAVAALQSLTDIDLEGMAYYTFEYGTFAGYENILISATGYTGSGGFEIYMPNHAAEAIWNAIFAAGADHQIRPIGLAARDTLRLEMGFCLYGNDIDDTTSPIEAGLGWITRFTKDFIHSDQLKAQKEAGIKKKLVGFEMIDKGIPRHDYPIMDSEGREVGRVTSGTMSPSLQKPIGMGYVPVDMAAPGTAIFIRVRNRDLKAEVVKVPFYKG